MTARDRARLAGAAVALILLFIGVMVGLRRESPTATPVVSRSREQVVALELSFSDGRLRLEREHDRWWMSEPSPKRPAHSERVEAAVNGLESATVVRTVTREASDPERYGLDAEQRLELTLEREDGTRAGLVLGSSTETGVYFSETEFEGVRLADRQLRELIPAEQRFYLERRVFPGDLEPGRIRGLTVESPGESYRLQYENFDTWRAREYERNAGAEHLEPSAPEVRAVLAALDRLSGEEVRPRGELALDRGADARIEVEADHGERHELALYVFGDEFWAAGYGERSLDDGYLVRLAANEVARVLRPLADLSR